MWQLVGGWRARERKANRRVRWPSPGERDSSDRKKLVVLTRVQLRLPMFDRLALAKGRKLHDKREVSKQKTIDKETRQALSERK